MTLLELIMDLQDAMEEIGRGDAQVEIASRGSTDVVMEVSVGSSTNAGTEEPKPVVFIRGFGLVRWIENKST